MNCYFHPERESVVSCAKCGVAMCRECEQNAYMRTDNGTGRALCIRCSKSELMATIDFTSKWIKKRLVKIILAAIFIVFGLTNFMSYKAKGDTATGIFFTIILWGIAGVIMNIGNKREETVDDFVFKLRSPFMSMIVNIMLSAILGPIGLLANIIGLIRTWVQHKANCTLLQKIKNAEELQ